MSQLHSLMPCALRSCYPHPMADLHIENIPDDLCKRLHQCALESNRTVSDVALAAVEHELARWEWRKRLDQRPGADLSVQAAALLHEERLLRDLELG